LNGNKKWPDILPDPSLLCRILTNLQFHSVSANKFNIVHLLNSLPVLVSIPVISQYFRDKHNVGCLREKYYRAM
jgi:hypothetical protein